MNPATIAAPPIAVAAPPQVPVIPESAPFTLEQRAWLNGFLAGLFSRGAAPADPRAARDAAPAATPPAALAILFGSQTGTAEALAKRAAKEARARGFMPVVRDMANVTPPQLASEKNALIITSTHGEGEPPDNAKALHAALGEAATPQLSGVRFSVCALGDTNYTQFCQCGKDFDARLEQLGATRVAPRVDCDLDFESAFTAWLAAALEALAANTSAASPALPVNDAPPAAVAARTEAASEAPAHSRTHPFPAPVLAVRRLSGATSAKDIHHIELSLEGSKLEYAAGDALGVCPHNCPQLVDDVLGVLGCDGEEAVASPTGAEIPLRRALLEFYELGAPTAELLALLASADRPHHVIDALAAASKRPQPGEFVARLRKLRPRLYSIASSPHAHAGQVHLTVNAVRYEAHGRGRKGVCSTFLSERATGANAVAVFVQPNPRFKLPANSDTPVIMIGPGTGIAPFRGFLHERRVAGARGRNWLFFGDQHAASDFLYREELLALQHDGLLTRLDLAWSRDQAEKHYVQHRLLEHSREVFAWLEDGAHLYVCGDAARMAKDVDHALHRAIELGGERTPQEAETYVSRLRAENRYARDVY